MKSVMKNLVLSCFLICTIQAHAQNANTYNIAVRTRAPFQLPVTIYFNGLETYMGSPHIKADFTKDCSLLIRQDGAKSAFVHFRKGEVKKEKSASFKIEGDQIWVNRTLMPLKAVENKDYSNKAIPEFVKLDFDTDLKHTFKSSLRIMGNKSESLMNLSRLDQKVIAENVYKVLRDEMGSEKTQEDLFSQSPTDSDLNDDILLAGRVKFLTYLQKGLKRTFNLAVEWSLYSKSKDSIIFKDISDIELVMDKNYTGIASYDAISLSIQKLLDYNQKFHDALKTKKDLAKVMTGEPIVVKIIKSSNELGTLDLGDLAKKSVVTIVRPDGGHGSGFLISEDGYLLTNAHVVETYSKLEIAFESGLKLNAKVVRINKTKDVALLKLEASGFRSVVIANKEPALGSSVTVVGTPASLSLGQSVSKGVLSGYREKDGQRYIQTDASVNPGNSGGPLLNESLEVIGIVVSKIAHEKIEGISFAIPIDDALEALNIKW